MIWLMSNWWKRRMRSGARLVLVGVWFVLMSGISLTSVEPINFDADPSNVDILTFIYGPDHRSPLRRAIICMEEASRVQRQSDFIFSHVVRLCVGKTPEERFEIYSRFDSLGHLVRQLHGPLGLDHSAKVQQLWFDLAVGSEDRALRSQIFRMIAGLAGRGNLSEAVRDRSVEVYDTIIEEIGFRYHLGFPNPRYLDAFGRYMAWARPVLAGAAHHPDPMSAVDWLLENEALLTERDGVLAVIDDELRRDDLMGHEALAYTLLRYRLGANNDADAQRIEAEIERLKEEVDQKRRDAFERRVRRCLLSLEDWQPGAVDTLVLDPLPSREEVSSYLHGAAEAPMLERAIRLHNETCHMEHNAGGWIAFDAFLKIMAWCRDMDPVDAFQVYTKLDGLGRRLSEGVRSQLKHRLPNSVEAQRVWYLHARDAEDEILREQIFLLFRSLEVKRLLAPELRDRCVADYDLIVGDMGSKFFLRFPNERYGDAFVRYMEGVAPILDGTQNAVYRLDYVLWVLQHDAVRSRPEVVRAFIDPKLANPEATALEQIAYTLFRYRLGLATIEDDQRMDRALVRVKEEDRLVLMERSEHRIRTLIACYRLGLGSDRGGEYIY